MQPQDVKNIETFINLFPSAEEASYIYSLHVIYRLPLSVSAMTIIIVEGNAQVIVEAG